MPGAVDAYVCLMRLFQWKWQRDRIDYNYRYTFENVEKGLLKLQSELYFQTPIFSNTFMMCMVPIGLVHIEITLSVNFFILKGTLQQT